MRQPPVIALAGVARAGKDVFADILVNEYGFFKFSPGHVIKDFYASYIAGDESIPELRRRMLKVNPELTGDQWHDFYEKVLLPFEGHDLMCDAHTEHDPHKQLLRPILEQGGELIYAHVLREYFRRVDAAWSAGKGVINARVGRVAEAQEWQKRGAVIIGVSRPGREPVSPWEIQSMREMPPFITETLTNDGTLEQWEAKVRTFIHGLLHPQPLAERLGIQESA